MNKLRASPTYANAATTIAAVAAVLALALIAVFSAQAGTTCGTVGSASGTPGDDRMCGTSGADTIFGLAGDDTLFGGGGNDRLDGSVGRDRLRGDSGNDVLIGGLGEDRLSGSSGDDDLRLRDGELDSLTLSNTCGPGLDRLDLDLVDAIAFPSLLVIGDCESRTVGAVNEGPNVKISRRSVRVGEDGRAAVRLRCPASLTAPCAGTLRIGETGKKSQGPPKAYSIDQGYGDNVSVLLLPRDRRKLQRSGEITAQVVSVEQGEFGDKTTIQTLTLIARD